MDKAHFKRLVENGGDPLCEDWQNILNLLSKVEELSKTLDANRLHVQEVEKTAALSNAAYFKLRQFVEAHQSFKDLDIDWEEWPESSLQCVHVDLQQANERLREHSRTQSAIIRDWQKFANQLSNILGCFCMTDNIVDAVKTLKQSRRKKRKS